MTSNKNKKTLRAHLKTIDTALNKQKKVTVNTKNAKGHWLNINDLLLSLMPKMPDIVPDILNIVHSDYQHEYNQIMNKLQLTRNHLSMQLKAL